MPIGSSDGNQYADETSMLMGIPVQEPRTQEKSPPLTGVPTSENNSPTGSVEPSRGIVDKLLGTTGERYQTWPEKLVRSALTAAGDAYSGKLPMWAQNEDGTVNTSPMAIERANDLGTFAVLGPAPVAAKLADGTLGSFAGVTSKTLNKNRLSAAQEFETNGMHPDDVYTQTGMFRGADNRWRYEISDHGATVNEAMFNKLDNGNLALKRPAKLSEIYDHPELYKAYPHLKDIEVGRLAIDNPNLGEMGKDVMSLSMMPPDQLKSTIAHELQHAIQDYEGFARGGSPSAEKLNYHETIDRMKTEANGLVDKYKDTSFDKIPDKDIDRIVYLNKVLQLEIDRKAAGESLALRNYFKLAGEVEARNVEKRLKMGAKTNKILNPTRTEDVPRSQQVALPEPTYATPYGYSTHGEPPIPE